MDGRTALLVAEISAWIDGSYPADIDPEAALWRRIGKIGEEHGEVIAALIGAIGENPRKGVTHTMEDVQGELLDVALCALCAVEHLNENDGSALGLLVSKISSVARRAAAVGVPADQERNEQ